MFGWTGRKKGLQEAPASVEDMIGRSSALLEQAEDVMLRQRAHIARLEYERAVLQRAWAHGVQNWTQTLQVSQTQNAEDARRIVAYERWCREQDCVPTEADMERLSQ